MGQRLSGFGERDFELAQQRADQERDAGIRAAVAAPLTPGSSICIDCEEPMEAVRRLAMPSARRCIHCQTDFEKA